MTRALLLTVSLLSLEGCVFVSATLSRPLAVDWEMPPSTWGRVTLLDVRDERGRERCGMKKNGYNLETAQVHCAEPPTLWLRDELARGLRAQGLELNGTPGSLPAVQATLRHFFAEPDLSDGIHFSPETDVELYVRVFLENGAVAERNFYVKGVQDAFVATDDDFQRSADAATEKLARRVSSAVAELLRSTTPTLAAPPAL